MAVTSFGIGIPGLTNHVLLSSFPLGYTLRTAISTIRSLVMLTPVVSKSKKQMGFVKLSCIYMFLIALKNPTPFRLGFSIFSIKSNFPVEVPSFQIIFHPLNKLAAQGTIYHPMVVR